MKTIQIVIPEELLANVDKICGQRNRSAFFRKLAENWLQQEKIKRLEKKQIQGYSKYPIKAGEFDLWHDEQVWPE